MARTRATHAAPLRVSTVAHVLATAAVLALLWLVWPQSMHGAVAYVGVDGHSMDGTYADGDLIAVRAQSSYAVGDIVTYRIPKGEFGAGANVIHRIIGGNGETGFTTQGDNKPLPDPWHPRTGDVLGKSALRIPGGARYFLALAQPVPLGGLCAGLTVFVMLLPGKSKPRHRAASASFA
jgi:signal peptidase I